MVMDKATTDRGIKLYENTLSLLSAAYLRVPTNPATLIKTGKLEEYDRPLLGEFTD